MKDIVETPFRIGDVSIPNRLVLAPLAGINDVAFRELCHEFGAGLVFTGMRHSESVMHTDIQVSENERPLAIQLVGRSPESMAKAAQELSQYADIIDINMGCPAPKLTGGEAGAALLRDPERALRIVLAVCKAVSCPVTVKLRSGYERPDHEATIQLAHGCVSAGAKAITLHSRSVSQGYGGSADWPLIEKLVKVLDVPVIGNGDVRSFEQARQRLSETGCAAVMLGRAAMGNPLVFSGREISLDAKRNLFFDYWRRLDARGEIPFSYVRMQALNFLKGFEGSRRMRREASRADTAEALREALTTY